RGPGEEGAIAALRLGRTAPGEDRGRAWSERERPGADTDRLCRLQPGLGLRDMRRLSVPVSGVHRAHPGTTGYAPLPDDERSEHARDGRADADADRTARTPVAGHAIHSHVVDG